MTVSIRAIVQLYRLITKCNCLTSCLFVFSAFSQCGIAQDAAPPAKPNVLMIIVDDLNDWVGCLQGNPQTVTPNIDRLAANGVLFTNAHCQGPLCGPSRASMFSGLYPHTTGVYQQPRGSALAEDKEHFAGKLLPEYFAQHGYKTLGVGKLTHGYPADKAFQEYGGWPNGYGPKPANDERFNFHPPEGPYSGTQTDWGAFPETDEDMPDFKSASWAIEKLQQPHEKPFFLAVGMVRPHVPFYVPQKWFDQVPADALKLPELYLEDLNDVPEISAQIHEMPKYPSIEFLIDNDEDQYRKCVQAYLACIRFVDMQIGRVLQALAESQHARETIIVLCSDHGYHLGEKNRVSKHSLWEEATRVPLIISPPEIRYSGQRILRRTNLPVGLIDIYPTLVELCGLPANATNEGRSLVPLLTRPVVEDWRPGILTTYARGNHALRTTTHRLIRYEDGSLELYEHETDPEEWDNLAGPAQTNRAAMQRNKELVDQLIPLFPTAEAPYHPATSKTPINAWFEEHLIENGVITAKEANDPN